MLPGFIASGCLPMTLDYLECLELSWRGAFWPFSCAGCFVVWSWKLVVWSFCLDAQTLFPVAWSWLLLHDDEVTTELTGP